MKKLILILSLAFALPILNTGCPSAPLEKTGVYAGKSTLYATDSSIAAAFQVLDVFLSFQMQNRATLPKEINDFADKLRVDAPKWGKSLVALRDTYAASPTPQNKANLDLTLRLLREAVTQASTYLVVKPTSL